MRTVVTRNGHALRSSGKTGWFFSEYYGLTELLPTDRGKLPWAISEIG